MLRLFHPIRTRPRKLVSLLDLSISAKLKQCQPSGPFWDKAFFQVGVMDGGVGREGSINIAERAILNA
jgi:hypothetical protein